MNQIDIIGAMPKKTEILFEKIASGNELEDFYQALNRKKAIFKII